MMSEVTDKIKTLEDALARIETLEAENAHLLKVIKERRLAGYANCIGGFTKHPYGFTTWQPVYYISDEYDAAGFLITPEVKIEQ